MSRYPILRRCAAAVGLALAPACVLAASGQITFVVGDVAIVKANGQRVAAQRGAGVDAGDRIETGANGMAQLTMVDEARLSLRPNTQFAIESYPAARDGAEGAVLSLVRGTLRAFTGLIASTNRDKFVMKTRVATVGIRGSGNILYACDGGNDCDPSVRAQGEGEGPITVNHTIEGSHAVTNLIAGVAPGTPPQQGGAQTLITGPGQTVMVRGSQAPRYIPTPSFVSDVATNMTNAKSDGLAAGSDSAAGGRSFSPSDVQALPASVATPPPLVGNNGLGFPLVDASGNLSSGDPLQLRDVIMSLGSPFSGQSRGADVDFTGNEFRGYKAYVGGSPETAAAQQAIHPYVNGGTLKDSGTIIVGGGVVSYGRWENGSLSFNGPGGGTPIPGSIHFIQGPSAFPPYLSEVLTGTATYTLAGGTSPTNQVNTTGTLNAATINVNFNNRSLDLSMRVGMPAAAGNTGGNWSVSGTAIPIALNGFSASTQDRLAITNGNGVDSRTNTRLFGGVQGSFVGTGLGGIVMGYGISDTTASTNTNWNILTGVAGFNGPTQPTEAAFREGRVSDAAGNLTDFVRDYATTDRPDEVVGDATGRVTGFTAPFSGQGSHATYALGSAQVVQQGIDPQTGLVWGRWAGGTATVNGQPLSLANSSLHYIFSGAQSGPVALPLTGSAAYDVIGSTSPTDHSGHVGTLGSAALNANFSARTVDANVAININGQAWTGSASGMPIYRDQYFSAYTGNPIPGGSNPAPMTVGCTPNCGLNASGSFDGFFAGASGQRAGLMYNLGPNQGAVAFGRRGG